MARLTRWGKQIWGTSDQPGDWHDVKIATYNINGVNGRLPVLLRWLAESAPDIVCLQELKGLHPVRGIWRVTV